MERLQELARRGFLITIHDANYGREPTLYEVIVDDFGPVGRCGGLAETLEEAIEHLIEMVEAK